MKTVIFDFDGTIADSESEGVRIYNQLAAKYGFGQIDSLQIPEFKSKRIRELIKILGIPMYKIPRLVYLWRKEFGKSVATLKVFSWMPEILQALKARGFKIGLLSSNAQENILAFLKNNDLEIFDFIYTGASVFGKGRLLNNALKTHQLIKNETIYVGDEMRDIEAARKVGIKIISVTWGLNSEQGLKSLNPDYIVNRPEEILKII